jgi:hypothetical protein
MRIWIIDLRGAYTLLSFRPEDVGLFATLLSDDLVYLQMVGNFLFLLYAGGFPSDHQSHHALQKCGTRCKAVPSCMLIT